MHTTFSNEGHDELADSLSIAGDPKEERLRRREVIPRGGALGHCLVLRCRLGCLRRRAEKTRPENDAEAVQVLPRSLHCVLHADMYSLHTGLHVPLESQSSHLPG